MNSSFRKSTPASNRVRARVQATVPVPGSPPCSPVPSAKTPLVTHPSALTLDGTAKAAKNTATGIQLRDACLIERTGMANQLWWCSVQACRSRCGCRANDVRRLDVNTPAAQPCPQLAALPCSRASICSAQQPPHPEASISRRSAWAVEARPRFAGPQPWRRHMSRNLRSVSAANARRLRFACA